MIDGYESTVTLAAGLRNVLLVWTLPGLAWVVLGLMGSAGAGRSIDSGNLHWRSAVETGAVLLQIVTLICFVLWAVRTWANVPKLGRKPRIGIWSLFLRHVWFFLASILLAFGSGISQSGRTLLILLAIGSGFLGLLFVPLVVLELVRMLWRTSSPPSGGMSEALPRYGGLWFAAWLGYSITAGTFTFAGPGLAPSIVSLSALVAGVSCTVAAVTGAKLVTVISRRQDERMRIIISNVEPGSSRRSASTAEHIDTAWADSESLVCFDGH